MCITPPPGRLSMLHVSTAVEIVSVPKRSALEASRRELSEDVPFGTGTLLVVEQSTLERRTPQRGGDTHRRIRKLALLHALFLLLLLDA